MTRIRDPIHGAIEIDDRERAVLDAPFVQRLRGVRQLGFSEMAFPGATHTRYAHALGACHVLGRLFDSIFEELPDVPDSDVDRLRAEFIRERLAVIGVVGDADCPVESSNLPDPQRSSKDHETRHEAAEEEIGGDRPLPRLQDGERTWIGPAEFDLCRLHHSSPSAETTEYSDSSASVLVNLEFR